MDGEAQFTFRVERCALSVIGTGICAGNEVTPAARAECCMVASPSVSVSAPGPSNTYISYIPT